MKYFLYISFLLVFVHSSTTFAQNCSGDEMSTMKFVDGFPYGGTTFTLDYQDIRVIKWNDSKISGTPIYLNNINTDDYIPFELLDEINNITTLYSQMISEWNNNYSLQLAINTNEDNINVQFSDNPDLFDSGNPNSPAIGRTMLPVEEDFIDGYKFYEHTDYGETGDGTGFALTDGVVYLNSADNQGFTWTTSTTPQFGDYMFGTILLHELGHVLSMGHIENSYVDAVMKASYNPAAVTPSLKSCDISNAAFHSEQLYGLVVGISNGIDVTTYPSFMDENQQYSMNANFYKGDPYSTDHVLSWNWIIKLYHANGTYEYVNETFSGSSYWYSCPWSLTTTTLPSGYNWTLNTSGHIATDIVVSAQIAGDGVSPITKIVSFNTEPTQPQNLTIAWYNNHPKLTWDTNMEDDISSYKVWKNAEGSSMIAATITHNPNNNTHSWIDYNVTRSGKFDPSYQFNYKVKAVDNTNKESIYSNMVSIWGNGGLWKINNEENLDDITTYKLFTNYPNPFNPSTIIEFDLPSNSYTNLTVYNTIGEVVSILVSQNLEKGKYSYKFNASGLPSGIYIYKLSSGAYSSIKKMMLIK